MKKRNPSIDLLRIIAMLFIIMTHLLQNAGVVWYVENFKANYFVLWLLFFITFCGMNCFGLISGYVGINSEFKLKKLGNLWFQAFFYGVVILALFFIFSRDLVDTLSIKKAFLPVTFSSYWYFTAYFALYIISPFLNAAINSLEKEKARLGLILISIAFSLPGFILYEDPFLINEGYSFLWICLMYMIGGYVRKYDVATTVGLKKSLIIFWSCIAIEFIGKSVLEMITVKVFGVAKFGFHFVGHTTPFLLLQSVSFLLIFANIKITSEKLGKVISLFASTTLGVYFIHVDPLIFGNILNGSTVWLAYRNPFFTVGFLILMQGGIFLVCSLIDMARIKLFKLIKIK